jgi:predicted nucleic acid-binding protein
MSYLLDTDICVYFLRQHLIILERVRQYTSEGLAISIIGLAELQFGAYNSNQVKKNLERIGFLLERIPLLEVTPKTTEIYAKIKASLRKAGNVIDDLDIFIGATAIENDLALATANERHFSRIEGLRIVNWME